MREHRESGRARSGTARRVEGTAPRGAAVDGAGSGEVGPGIGGRAADGGVRARIGHQAPRRRATGPRPVRPAVVSVGVRPAQLDRPACRAVLQRPGPRVLVRRSVPAPPAAAWRFRVRRAVAAMLATLVTAAVVVALGLLADSASAARTPGAPPSSSVGGPSEVTVTVRAGESLGDIARRAAPGAETAAVVQRIVTANSLTSVQVRPGQMLRVPMG